MRGKIDWRCGDCGFDDDVMFTTKQHDVSSYSSSGGACGDDVAVS